MKLFAGMSKAYGKYTASSKTDSGKNIDPSPRTIWGELTPELWKNHLNGVQGLGVIPIREDNSAMFGAVDVDIYNIDHRALAERIERAKLPLIVCRTKSGGAHLYCFCQEAVTASSMKTKLAEVASFLGFGGQEIFPKQTKILVEQKDAGNWINMPYFNGLIGMRYAVDSRGMGLSPEEFLDYAYDRLAPPDWFTKLLVVASDFLTARRVSKL